MKLRLDNKSVRIRLSKEEILKLQNEGYLEEKISISDNNYFNYVVEVLDDIETCDVFFGEDGLQVGIPQKVSDKWINSNQVGIKETLDADDGDTITLFVEEDLPPKKIK